ncbi:MAG: DNA polymerase III subunit delta [Actinomycetota bacterium]|nr:DNA polymerase III subunit delta [Actinomycetota bacterium]
MIFGKEDLLLERALRRLKDMLAAEGDPDFDFDTFAGENARADDIIAAANTLPFMAPRRLVIVRDADKMSADELGVLAAYAGNPADTACLVLAATSVAKNMKIYKAVDALGGVSEYAAPKKSELPGWAVALFKSKGRALDREGAETLVRAVGKDLRRLESEADKIIAFAGEKTSLGRDDVIAVVTETAPTNIFEFLDALGSRDAAAALARLDGLIDGGDALLGIHAMTLRHLRSLLGVVALRERGRSAGEAGRTLKLADWQYRNLVRQADRFRADELSAALRAAAEAEGKMKTSQGDPRLVFERFIVSVCDRSGRTVTRTG